MYIKKSILSFLSYPHVRLSTYVFVSLVVIFSNSTRAQAQGVVDSSNGARTQEFNLSLQQLQEMDAVRREMSELRNLIERQGYEFNQYKRKSDQDVLVLREQLRALQGGIDGEGFDQAVRDSGFSLEVSLDAGELDTSLSNNNISNTTNQTFAGTFDEEPDAAMVDISMGGYSQSTGPNEAVLTSDVASPIIPESYTITSSDVFSTNKEYRQIRNVGANANNVDIVTPSTSQMVIDNENLNSSSIWEVQNVPNDQLGSGTPGIVEISVPSNQKPLENNSSELQWQVIRNSGPSSAPLVDSVTGPQIEQPNESQAGSISSRDQPSTENVLGDL